jgi:hypothetical protein
MDGVSNESKKLSQKNVPVMQDNPQEGRCARDLQEQAPQTAPGLSAGKEFNWLV